MAIEEKTGGTAVSGGEQSGGAGGGSENAIPKGLEQFAGSDGKLDLNKLGQSYLKLNEGFQKKSRDYATLQRSYDALAPKKEEERVVDSEAERGRQFGELAEKPKEYIESIARSTTANEAKAVKSAILYLAHPELSDPEFKKGVDEFAATLPPVVQANLDDYYTADWVVKKYKEGLKPAGEAAAANTGGSPHLESPTKGAPKVGKIYKRSDLRKMPRSEYAKIAEDVAKAYEEGRVLDE